MTTLPLPARHKIAPQMRMRPMFGPFAVAFVCRG
jgi:hypothetical protein